MGLIPTISPLIKLFLNKELVPQATMSPHRKETLLYALWLHCLDLRWRKKARRANSLLVWWKNWVYTDQEQVNWHVVVTNYGDLNREAGVTDRGSKCPSVGNTTGLLHTFSHTVRSLEGHCHCRCFPLFFLRKATICQWFFLASKAQYFNVHWGAFFKVAAVRATQLFGPVQPRNANLK